jgi:ABC-type sulfate transport system permease component
MSGPLTDRTATYTALLLALAFALFFVLPFVGLIDRAIEDGRTWELAKSDVVRDALVLSLWTSTVTVTVAVLGGTPWRTCWPGPRFAGRPSWMPSWTSQSCCHRR